MAYYEKTLVGIHGRNGETNFSACFLFLFLANCVRVSERIRTLLPFSLSFFCLKHKTDLGHSISKEEKDRLVSLGWATLEDIFFFSP